MASQKDQGQPGPELTPELINLIDSLYHDPGERALGIHQLIWPAIETSRKIAMTTGEDAPTAWDILCWANEYVARFAQGNGIPDLLQAAMILNGVVYSIHYSNASGLYGKPEKSGIVSPRGIVGSNGATLRQTREQVPRSFAGSDSRGSNAPADTEAPGPGPDTAQNDGGRGDEGG